MGLYREDAIVLRTYKLGEADRIVVLVTPGRGKVRAVAKGVRKTKSRFGGRLEPPGNVRLLLYEGRELDTISQADSIDHFRPIHEDLARLTDAMALVEAVDQVAQEGEANPPLYTMLQGALRTLAERRSPLLVAGFYLKLLALEGVAPVVDSCVVCGSGDGSPHDIAAARDFADARDLGAARDPAAAEDFADARDPAAAVEARSELVAIDLAAGGAVCRSCRGAVGGGLRASSPEVLDLVRRILGGDLRTALAVPSSPATAAVSDLATDWMERHLERRLRSVRALGT